MTQTCKTYYGAYYRFPGRKPYTLVNTWDKNLPLGYVAIAKVENVPTKREAERALKAFFRENYSKQALDAIAEAID